MIILNRLNEIFQPLNVEVSSESRGKCVLPGVEPPLFLQKLNIAELGCSRLS